MSAKKHHKTPLGRAADAFSLALVFGILYAATRLVPQFHGDTAVLAGLGFLLLSGTLMSELVEVLGVPHLTGYLLAGVLAGPHVFHLIDHETVTKLGPVNTLAIALIALAGGAELRLSTLREGLRSLLTAQLIQTVFGLLLMTGVFMVRQLPPWFENLGKRQVKAPKIYVRDSGLLHALLGVGNQRDLEHHPKVGASWEGYAVEEVLKALRPDEAYYWATYNGAEIDLVLFKDGRRIGVECKRADAPTLTPSMRIALSDLKLDELHVVYPGEKRYTLTDKVEVVPLAELVGASEG